MNRALAMELDAVKTALEEAAVSLCLDPAVFERHAEPLQCFDRLAQVIAEVAAVLRSTAAPDVALAGVRLDVVRERLVLSYRIEAVSRAKAMPETAPEIAIHGLPMPPDALPRSSFL